MRLLRPVLTSATAALLLGGVALAVPAVASASSPSSTAAACDRAPWEVAVQGAPKGFGAGSPSGDYLWHDASGFHLRVTHARRDQRVYSGTIRSSAPMRIEPVRLEGGDTLTLSRDRRTIVFVFANHGFVDGVNFHTDCAKALTMSRLHVGNSNLDRSRVYLGHTKAHPPRVPFTVHRLATHT
jgi:hypothetical protein